MIGVSPTADRSPFEDPRQYSDPPPISIPPPRPVTIAGILVLLEGFGLLMLAGATLISGLSEGIAIGRTLAQTAYYLVLALLLAACANGVLRGRRWGRTPCLVAQVVLVLVGIWLIVPSERYGWGVGLVLLGGVTGSLLVSRPANAWINRFPLPFAEPDQ